MICSANGTGCLLFVVLTRCKMLASGADIVEQINRGKIPTNLLCHGLKHRFRTNTPEEAEAIKSRQSLLRQSIAVRHIARVSDRSTGAIAEGGQIRWEKKCGKKVANSNCDDFATHETLNLMQNNQVALYDNEVVVSIEKAYCMFLRTSQQAIGFHIYAYLNKHGFGVNCNSAIDDDLPVSDTAPTERRENIWNYFAALSSQARDDQRTCRTSVTESMDQTIVAIRKQQPVVGVQSGSSEVVAHDKCETEDKLNQFMVINHLYRDIFKQLDIFENIRYANDLCVLSASGRALLASEMSNMHVYVQRPRAKRPGAPKTDTHSEYPLVVVRKCPSMQRAYEMYKSRNQGAWPIFIYITQENCHWSFVYRYSQ